MTKGEFITTLQERFRDKFDISKKDVEDVMNIFFNTVIETTIKEGKFTYPGFGTFKTAERAARKGRNPITGKPIDIPAKKVIQYKPSPAVKDKVNTPVKKKSRKNK